MHHAAQLTESMGVLSDQLQELLVGRQIAVGEVELDLKESPRKI